MMSRGISTIRNLLQSVENLAFYMGFLTLTIFRHESPFIRNVKFHMWVDTSIIFVTSRK